MKLGILEFGFYDSKNSDIDIIENIFEYVPEMESMGFERFWLTQHYHKFNCAWTSPEVILTALAASTSKIRLGLAGVLIHYCNPLSVATNFKMLDALFNGRIDLGIAAASVPEVVAKALRSGEVDIKKNVLELYNFLNNNFDENHSYLNIPVPPYVKSNLAMWFLSVSGSSSKYAIDYKANYSQSLFHKYMPLQEHFDVIMRFRDNYYRRHQEEAKVNIAVECSCFDDGRILRNNLNTIKNKSRNLDTHHIMGNINYCEDELRKLSEKCQVDELVIVYGGEEDLGLKQNSMELLGERIL